MRSAITLALLALAAFAAGSRPAAAQSYDCRAARAPDEQVICADPRLARLDEQLATLYHREMNQLTSEQRDAFQRHEIYFINARRRCGTDQRCIAQSYMNRIRELQAMLAQSEATGENEPASAAIAESEHRAPPPAGRNALTAQPPRAVAAEPEQRGPPPAERNMETGRAMPHAVAAEPEHRTTPPAERGAEPARPPHAVVTTVEPLPSRNAETVPPPHSKPPPKRHTTVTVDVAAPPAKPSPSAPTAGTTAGFGSSQWINPPPER